MPGYAFIVGECATCHCTFTFHPHKVPSVRIDGERKPLCRNCVEAANPVRIRKGLDPIEILPNAYEACPENEL